MLPCPGYYKQCCNEHWGACAFLKGMDKEDAVHIHNGTLLSHEKGQKMPLAAKWKDLDIVILGKMSDRKRQISFGITYM